MRNYGIKPGNWFTFLLGKKTPGTFHLNKFVRDILRECNIPCPHCSEGDCNEPTIELVRSLNVEYVNDAGTKLNAVVITLPEYADDSAAAADNYPINGWYQTIAGDVRIRKV